MGKLLLTVFAMVGLTMASGSWVAEHSGAIIVRTDGLGGRVQLVGAYMPATADAQLLMAAHCRGRFEVVKTGDAIDFQCTLRAVQNVAAGTELAMAATRAGL